MADYKDNSKSKKMSGKSCLPDKVVKNVVGDANLSKSKKKQK